MAHECTSRNDRSHHYETCWRVIDGPSGRLVVCAIYETPDVALELRVDHDHRTVRSALLTDSRAARTLAQQWLDAIRATESLPFSTTEP